VFDGIRRPIIFCALPPRCSVLEMSSQISPTVVVSAGFFILLVEGPSGSLGRLIAPLFSGNIAEFLTCVCGALRLHRAWALVFLTHCPRDFIYLLAWLFFAETGYLVPSCVRLASGRPFRAPLAPCGPSTRPICFTLCVLFFPRIGVYFYSTCPFPPPPGNAFFLAVVKLPLLLGQKGSPCLFFPSARPGLSPGFDLFSFTWLNVLFAPVFPSLSWCRSMRIAIVLTTLRPFFSFTPRS